MARNRIPFNSGSTPPITGPNYMNNIRDRIGELWDVSHIPLTTIAGTANAITAVCDPALISGVTTGMKFSFIAAATNTTGVTIALNGGSPINMRDDTGAALIAGQIVSGRLYTIEFDGTNLRVQGTSGTVVTNNYQVFTASGTWTKPAGCPPNALVTVQIWSGGGGGTGSTSSGSSGGGGGGMVPFTCKASDLSSTVAITVGAGGAINGAGGTSSFGALASSFGGGRAGGTGQPSCAGGGGGGGVQAGGNGAIGATAVASSPPGDSTGGFSTPVVASALAPTSTIANSGFYGGGAGGSFGGTVGENGGKSVWGGGGGASRTASAGGTSQFGGNGGAPGSGGIAPGGGGGNNAAGARGEVRVYVNG